MAGSTELVCLLSVSEQQVRGAHGSHHWAWELQLCSVKEAPVGFACKVSVFSVYLLMMLLEDLRLCRHLVSPHDSCVAQWSAKRAFEVSDSFCVSGPSAVGSVP